MMRKKERHAGSEGPLADEVAPESAEAPDAGGDPAGAVTDQGLRAELDRARAREDELLRAVAELTNVNRRRKQETETILQFAQEDLVRDLLPVLDDLDRALVASKGQEHDPLRRGVALVRERLWRILEKEGLEPIQALGARFDPERFEAVAQAASTDQPPDTVIEVVVPGYKFKGRVLRHAQVIVAGPAAGAPKSAGPRPGAAHAAGEREP
jgi:molecular chaperone GrpE